MPDSAPLNSTSFDMVGETAVEVDLRHAVAPERQRHGGAGLGIGGDVGQVVFAGEALVGVPTGRARR